MASVGGIFKAIAPWIFTAASTMLPGPLGAAALAVGKAIGKDVPADNDAIAQAVAGATPEQMAAIKAADQQFQLDMTKLGFEKVEDLAKMAYDDTANARARESAVKDRTPEILAYLLVGSSIAMCWYVISGHGNSHDVAGATLVGTVLGYVISEAKQAVAYFLGSSAGSSDKNEAIVNLSK
jgi:hypothetical protein